MSSSIQSQFAEARRSQQIDQLTKDRKQQHAYQTVEWKKRYLEKQNETTRRAHEDSLKHLQVISCFASQFQNTNSPYCNYIFYGIIVGRISLCIPFGEVSMPLNVHVCNDVCFYCKSLKTCLDFFGYSTLN